jgi:FkbM family methyltransferase
MDFKKLLAKYGKTKRDGIIHVGAHIGEEIGFYKELGFAKILLFEPLTEPFGKIPVCEGVYKVNCALGSTNETLVMNVADNFESSSILKPSHHLVAHPDVKFVGEESVSVKRLDDWFETNEFALSMNDFSCMVLDAQGYEGKIVLGATETLKRMDVVYSEVSVQDLYHENTHMNYLDYQLNRYNLNRKETWISYSGSGEAIYIKDNT